MLELEFAQLSDLGKVRAQNEDFIGYAEPRTQEHARNQGWLFALADGCGGHDRGEVLEHPQAPALALLGMVLRRVDAAVLHGRGKANSILTPGHLNSRAPGR